MNLVYKFPLGFANVRKKMVKSSLYILHTTLAVWIMLQISSKQQKSKKVKMFNWFQCYIKTECLKECKQAVWIEV